MTLEELLNKSKKASYRRSSEYVGVLVKFSDSSEFCITEYDWWELRQLQLGVVFQNADTTRKELKEKFGSNLD